MHVELNGPAGRLEALLDAPGHVPRAAAVLAHPHPEYGGTMRSRVVHEAAKGLVRAGAAVLRFNYRGTGLSDGALADEAHAVLDFQAALEEMARRYPGLPLWAAGYSFGAWVAMSAGIGDGRVTAFVAIAPPLGHFGFAPLSASVKSKFLIQAERDEMCPLSRARSFYASLAEPRDLVVIEDAGHAFDGKASEVGAAIEDLLGAEGRGEGG